MKGRICYARFWDEPGIEKLFTFIEVKSSFLKPVTSRPCGVAFLIRESVAGALVCRPDNTVQSKPVTVLFSKLFLTPGGLQSLQLSSLRAVVHAVRRFFLYHWFHSVWPVSIFWLNSPGPTASRPPSFSMPYIFYMAVVPTCRCRRGEYACGPTVLRRYRDINQSHKAHR